jgi:hypothetical protein
LTVKLKQIQMERQTGWGFSMVTPILIQTVKRMD